MAYVQTRSVADKASLSDLRRRIRADLARAGVDPALTFDCLVAVTEACTQALLAGVELGDGPAVTWELDATTIRFEVLQSSSLRRSKASHPSAGPRFAIRDVVDEALPLALMENLMDRVTVQDGPGGRIITLTKQLFSR